MGYRVWGSGFVIYFCRGSAGMSCSGSGIPGQ